MSIELKGLIEPLPKEAISKHPTKTYLSSIKAIYVTERFTNVFGIGKWTTKVEKEHVNFETGMVIVKVTFEVPELKIYYESYGGNDNGGINNKNFDLGDAYKGATTDALTKIGSYLGVGIDVFKGKINPLPEKKEPIWLTKEQYEKAINADEAGVRATIKAFSTTEKAMKKEYRDALSQRLEILKRN